MRVLHSDSGVETDLESLSAGVLSCHQGGAGAQAAPCVDLNLLSGQQGDHGLGNIESGVEDN